MSQAIEWAFEITFNYVNADNFGQTSVQRMGGYPTEDDAQLACEKYMEGADKNVIQVASYRVFQDEQV